MTTVATLDRNEIIYDDNTFVDSDGHVVPPCSKCGDFTDHVEHDGGLCLEMWFAMISDPDHPLHDDHDQLLKAFEDGPDMSEIAMCWPCGNVWLKDFYIKTMGRSHTWFPESDADDKGNDSDGYYDSDLDDTPCKSGFAPKCGCPDGTYCDECDY